MEVQDFLRNGGTLEGLQEKYSLLVKRHRGYPNLVLLKYHIDSPLSEKLVQECRGVILDAADNWNVVARGFDKFFNHGEPLAAPIHWESAKIQEKLDGSICMLYYYDNKWHVATSGIPDAEGEVPAKGFTFKELFWKTWGERLLPDEIAINGKNYSYLFELTSPYNRVVVPHTESKITLLAIRDPQSGKYLDIDSSIWPGFYRVVQSFSLITLDDVLAASKELNPMSQEGFVVTDRDFNRIKIKSPQYVALHHIKDQLTVKGMLGVIRTNESTEFLTYFPEYREMYEKVVAAYQSLASAIDSDYEKIKHIESQKDFAFEALKTKISSALFSIRKGKYKNAEEFLVDARTELILDNLGLKIEDAGTLQEV